MAEDGTGAISAAMEEHQNAIGIAAGDDRPLARYAAEIDRGESHVIGYGPDRTDLVETLSPLSPTDGSRLGGQQRADGLDFVLSHQVMG